MNIDFENYPYLYLGENGTIEIKDKKVSMQSLIYYDKISLSREKLFDFLNITEEELDCAKEFLKNEIGVTIYA